MTCGGGGGNGLMMDWLNIILIHSLGTRWLWSEPSTPALGTWTRRSTLSPAILRLASFTSSFASVFTFGLRMPSSSLSTMSSHPPLLPWAHSTRWVISQPLTPLAHYQVGPSPPVPPWGHSTRWVTPPPYTYATIWGHSTRWVIPPHLCHHGATLPGGSGSTIDSFGSW